MRHPIKSNSLSVIKQNISYYDEIAVQYDETLDNDHSNEIIREKVASVFNELVSSGLVLDFGGGTGKDLAWLIKKGYRVIFCEPSAKMREKAILLTHNNSHIVFLESTATDFATWEANLPFSQNVDAILANFAVINCIPDIELLFKNLSLVIRAGGHLLMLVIKSDFKKRWRSNRRATLLSLFTAATVTTDIKFNLQRQRVYLHSIPKIKRAAGLSFHFQRSLLVKENDFVLLHFTRK